MTVVTATARIDGWVGDLTYDPDQWERMEGSWATRYPTIDRRAHQLMEKIARSASAHDHAAAQGRLDRYIAGLADRGVRVAAADFRRAQFEHYHRRPVTPLPD